MKRLTRFLAALTAALLLLTGLASAATDVVQVRTTSYGATLRKTPEQNDTNKITLIPADTYLAVHDKVGNWYYVEYNGQYGYVTAGEKWVEAVAWDADRDGVWENADLRTAQLGKSGLTRDAVQKMGGIVIEINGTIGTGGSNVRSAMDPNDDLNIVRVLHEGTQVFVYFRLPNATRTGQWYYVRCPDGAEGFVFSTKLNLNADG